MDERAGLITSTGKANGGAGGREEGRGKRIVVMAAVAQAGGRTGTDTLYDRLIDHNNRSIEE